MAELEHELTALTRDECLVVDISRLYAVCYCWALSAVFVAALYLLIPAKIRALDRNDAVQIAWRMAVVSIVCIVATYVLFPLLFCRQIPTSSTCSSQEAKAQTEMGDGHCDQSPAPSAFTLMGWTRDDVPSSVMGVLLHVCLLYTGHIVASLLYVHVTSQRMRDRSAIQQNYILCFVKAYYLLHVEPLVSLFINSGDMSAKANERFCIIRNLLFAPLSEEIVFRGCMITPLLATGMKPVTVCFLAPLFFGTAHIHHAILKWKQGVDIRQVVMSTLFQFAYTSIFGAYASFVLIRTGSILAAAACHSLCNYFGFPNLGFWQQRGSTLSCLFRFRWLLTALYMLGIAAFVRGFQSRSTALALVPPPPGRLLEAINLSPSPDNG